MSYDSRVESGVEAVRSGPGTCLIGKESEMYSKRKKKMQFITVWKSYKVWHWCVTGLHSPIWTHFALFQPIFNAPLVHQEAAYGKGSSSSRKSDICPNLGRAVHMYRCPACCLCCCRDPISKKKLVLFLLIPFL